MDEAVYFVLIHSRSLFCDGPPLRDASFDPLFKVATAGSFYCITSHHQIICRHLWGDTLVPCKYAIYHDI